ncbi:MAG: hypothetical protein EXS37_06640 [Opitutus sp.]|nr:hypothetical protein [Opitutus sp.]
MTHFHPIEIVGGGLAGLSLGIALRREKVPVTLHEAGDYPRHRVCGEFITGLAPTTIARLQLGSALRGALRHEEVAWSIGERPPQFQRLPSPALGLSRHTLDARLASEFVAAGGTLHTCSRVTESANRAGRVFATGRRRAVEPRWIGLKIHAHNLPLERELEMHLGTDCYVGLARIENDGVNVCGLFRRRGVAGRGPGLLLGYLRAAGLNALAARLASAPLDAASFCAVAALGFDRRVSANAGRICLGDAAAMIPPFTGNGMAMAFQSAEAALDPLLAYARGKSGWGATCAAAHTALRRRFRVRLVSAGALHPFLLSPRPQRWFAALGRARLLPFGPLYATLH